MININIRVMDKDPAAHYFASLYTQNRRFETPGKEVPSNAAFVEHLITFSDLDPQQAHEAVRRQFLGLIFSNLRFVGNHMGSQAAEMWGEDALMELKMIGLDPQAILDGPEIEYSTIVGLPITPEIIKYQFDRLYQVSLDELQVDGIDSSATKAQVLEYLLDQFAEQNYPSNKKDISVIPGFITWMALSIVALGEDLPERLRG